jgi:hypothetical protein
VALIRAAVERGVTFFDTAEAHGAINRYSTFPKVNLLQLLGSDRRRWRKS